jgi:hypothetical protein
MATGCYDFIMSKHLTFFPMLLLVSLGMVWGCETEPTLSPNKTAALYFGLSDHTRCFERSDGVLESWAITTFVESDDYWQYQITATSNGFTVQERSLSLRVTSTGLYLESWNDCSSSCLQPQVPIEMFSHPVYARDRLETDVSVEYRLGDERETVDETHVFHVGDAREISTLEGSQEGWDVQWIRTRGDDILTHTLVFVPQVGLVGWTDQAGIELTQIECTE